MVSVPDGAPAKVKEGALPKPDADTKYSYLWECRAVLDQASRILVATDNDAPGHALAEELARRLGKLSCVVLLLSGVRSFETVVTIILYRSFWQRPYCT